MILGWKTTNMRLVYRWSQIERFEAHPLSGLGEYLKLLFSPARIAWRLSRWQLELGRYVTNLR